MRAPVKMTAAALLAALALSLAAASSPASAGGGTWHSGWRGAGIGWAGAATGAALATASHAYGATRAYEYGNFDGDYGANYYAFPGCPGRPLYDFWGNILGTTSAC